MRPTLSKDAIERELSLLYDYEEGMTYAQLGERESQCRQRIYQRLARARRIRAEIQRQEQVSSPGGSGQVGGSDLPYLALTDDPSREKGDWYDLDTDRCSHDGEGGLVRIGASAPAVSDKVGGHNRRPMQRLEGRLSVVSLNDQIGRRKVVPEKKELPPLAQRRKRPRGKKAIHA